MENLKICDKLSPLWPCVSTNQVYLAIFMDGHLKSIVTDSVQSFGFRGELVSYIATLGKLAMPHVFDGPNIF